MKNKKNPLINGLIILKQDILDSNYFLLPDAIIRDEETLDNLFTYAIDNIDKKYEDYTEEDKKLTNILGTVTLHAQTLIIAKHPERLQTYYHNMMKLDLKEFDIGNLIEVFAKHLKDNLITHEEYEKIIEMDKKYKNP